MNLSLSWKIAWMNYTTFQKIKNLIIEALFWSKVHVYDYKRFLIEINAFLLKFLIIKESRKKMYHDFLQKY